MHGYPRATRVTVTADGQAYTGACTLMGVSAVGGAAVVHDNTSATAGTAIAAVLAGSTVWFGPNGIKCDTGLYVDLTVATSVSVFYTLD